MRHRRLQEEQGRRGARGGRLARAMASTWCSSAPRRRSARATSARRRRAASSSKPPPGACPPLSIRGSISSMSTMWPRDICWRANMASRARAIFWAGRTRRCSEVLRQIANLTARRPPRLRLPRGPLYPIAHVAEAIARVTGKEPLVTRRCARHVEAPDVLQLGEGAGRTGLSRPALCGGAGRCASPGSERRLHLMAAWYWQILFGYLPLAIWLYLLCFRGMFWRARERDDRMSPCADPPRWPSVTAVVPARNEADVIETTHRQPARPGLSGRASRRAGRRRQQRRHGRDRAQARRWQPADR